MRKVLLSILIGLNVTSISVWADLSDLSGSFQTELEERSAASNQTVYDQLKASGCNDNDRGPTANCAGTDYIVWKNVRELVHTANELVGNGPTTFSLDSNLEGLGFALRWTAGEEFSTQESMTNSFTSGQLNNLTSRVTALRAGSTGFRYAGAGLTPMDQIAHGNTQTGINAGDDVIEKWSPWGGFINGGYTYGNQTASDREAAFDFDGYELNGGVDYRLNNNWVFGGLIGYIEQEIDFDSTQSIVDGTVTMTSLSVMPFALYQSDDWYANLSIGYQDNSFETRRSIRYPSFNPNIASTDTVALSDNAGDTLSSSASTGYSWTFGGNFTVEPIISVNYMSINIDAYSELDIKDDSFNFSVDTQSFQSLETSFALRAQYIATPNFGVFMPYIRAEWLHQHENDERFIGASYADAANTLNDNAKFLLPTNTPETEYKVYTAGLAAVIRGARKSNLDGPASGGVQVFLEARQISDVKRYSQNIFSGGIRYEF